MEQGAIHSLSNNPVNVSPVKKLSIVIPAYNEELSITGILDKLRLLKLDFDVEREIIVVNDCSRDRTEQKVQEYMAAHPEMHIRYLAHAQNQGKGGAVRTGLTQAHGDVAIIQDADLEYDPNDYNPILDRFINHGAQVVYGSRILKQKQEGPKKLLFAGKHPNAYASAYLGGVTVTKTTNLFTGQRLTDEPTCYKAFRKEVLEKLHFEENDFAWEPEITVKVSRLGIKIQEVPISYYPRKTEEGKKIGWKDGVKALYTVVKYAWFKR